MPVSGAVVLAPHVLTEPFALTAIRAARTAFDDGDLRTRMARHHDDPDAAFRGWNDMWLAEEFTDWDVRDTLPGITAPVSGMVEAMRRVAGDAAAQRVVYKPDERIQKIVAGWPVRFRTSRALAMGFKPDVDLDSVIRAYIADEGIKPA